NALGPSGLALSVTPLALTDCNTTVAATVPRPPFVDSCAVFFATDRYHLSGSATGTLRAFASRWRDQTVKKIIINGYTDAVGTAAYNQTLSENRAATVAAFLRAQLPELAADIIVSGKGEATSAGETNTEQRRVRVRVLE
ncbi:MAG: OmpA family protein, partial [Bacteroidota bacterium]